MQKIAGRALISIPHNMERDREISRFLQWCTTFKMEHKQTESIGAFHANALREREWGIGGGGSLDAHTASRSGVARRLLAALQTVGRLQG
jgi:hypothetical protein